MSMCTVSMPDGEYADARRGPSLWTEVSLASEASYFRRHQPPALQHVSETESRSRTQNRCRRVLFKYSKAAD
jgi:hypothetical protein